LITEGRHSGLPFLHSSDMTFEQEMQAMACDPDIRAECEAIAGEFADSQFDGLGERLTRESGAADNQSLC